MTAISNGLVIDAERGLIHDTAGHNLVKIRPKGDAVVYFEGKTLMASRLIWESVHGPIPAKQWVRAINGARGDLRVANLELVRHGHRKIAMNVLPEHGLVLDAKGRSRVKFDGKGRAVVWQGNTVRMVARLIWEHVNGPIPIGRVVNHINGNLADNRIANLRLSYLSAFADPDTGIVYGRNGRPVANRDKHGYILLCTGRARKARYGLPTYGHQLVWETVHGPIQAGMTINHLNGIKDDNRIVNLELVTQSDNMHHAYRTGLIDKVGEAHHHAKLTEEDVHYIRANAWRFEDQEMAETLGVSKWAVRDARNGKNWSHLPGAVRKK